MQLCLVEVIILSIGHMWDGNNVTHHLAKVVLFGVEQLMDSLSILNLLHYSPPLKRLPW